MVYKLFDKKSRESGIKENKELSNELHKPIRENLREKSVFFF